MSKKLEGIIVPLVTPFKENGELDLGLAVKEIEYLVQNKIDGISPGGSTGEGSAVTDDELVSLIKLIREIDKNIPITAGVIRTSTRAALKTARVAQETGADALMITPVFYNVAIPDERGNFAFFQTISDEVDLPIVVYNVIPNNVITAEMFNSLLDIKNVMGIKQSYGGIGAMYEMKMVNGNKGKIYAATDDMLFTTFELGADGAISAILTVFPEICIEMWEAAKNGDHKKGMELQGRIYSVWNAIAGSQFPIRVKYTLSLLGRKPGYARSPLCYMSDSEKHKIETELRKAGFIK